MARYLFVASLLSVFFSISAIAAAPAAKQERRTLDAWRKSMARVRLPKKGCFKTSYPNTEWHEVPCAAAPERTYGPHLLYTVGSAVDFSAVVAGHIASATGSFDAVNVTGENNSGNPDTYSLQLNSEYFTSPACSGSSNPNVCKGWQQFIYSTTLASAFIEYWLIDYAAPCPAGWSTLSIHCVKNSVAIPVAAEPVANLMQVSLGGSASAGGSDTLMISTTGGDLSAMYQDDELSLAQGWKLAEFGIFGDGGGSDATFNPGATMAVRTTVDDGTTNAPTCALEGYTSETNNLNLVPPCCPYGGAFPAVVFWLSNNPGATSSCVGGTSIGDTHLTNFNGLFYDFQAAGDFLLAETNPDFVVQTRQKSGAPTWPNASVNKAVAMKLGPTRAAVCLDPTRLVIDGQQSALADDQSLTLPTGVHVARSGNAYLFTRPSGESVRADVNAGYINVSVNLGAAPQAKVYGLLGNANGNMGEDDLATRNRVVLAQPLQFADLYHPYADSWRVAPRESLLSNLCGDRDIERSVPTTTFYARDLDPRLYERSRAVCTEAGVRDETLLDACTIDVTVIGSRDAARVFARTRPPRAELRPEPPRR
ncbi:MAG TPA: VWD domain-containing protein [Thermoanaerobaculia bacterium]|nr:VWD domain-containing protein [Thermoanaerobaculia bacterium]